MVAASGKKAVDHVIRDESWRKIQPTLHSQQQDQDLRRLSGHPVGEIQIWQGICDRARFSLSGAVGEVRADSLFADAGPDWLEAGVVMLAVIE